MNATRHGNNVARVVVLVFLLGITLPAFGQVPQLSPGAREVSVLIGADPLIEQYYHLPQQDRGVSGGPMTLEALTLRQRISESILTAELEADGVVSEIEAELERLRTVQLPLEARRDRQLQINSIANIIAGAVGAVGASAANISNPSANTGNILNLVGGAVSTFLGVIGIRQAKGGTEALTGSPNMLAPFFGKHSEYHTSYPEPLWKYLNSPVPTEPDKGTRRDRLLKDWLEQGDISQKSNPKEEARVEFLTSSNSEHLKLTIDLINQRSSMLLGVRTWMGLFKRDLSKLMLAIRV